MDQESIVLGVERCSFVAAIKQGNTAVKGWEKSTVGAVLTVVTAVLLSLGTYLFSRIQL